MQHSDYEPSKLKSYSENSTPLIRKQFLHQIKVQKANRQNYSPFVTLNQRKKNPLISNLCPCCIKDHIVVITIVITTINITHWPVVALTNKKPRSWLNSRADALLRMSAKSASQSNNRVGRTVQWTHARTHTHLARPSIVFSLSYTQIDRHWHKN